VLLVAGTRPECLKLAPVVAALRDHPTAQHIRDAIQWAEQQDLNNVAAHLRAGGCFVVEVMVPELRRLPPGQSFVPFDVSPPHVGFDEYDVVSQRLVSHHYGRRDDGLFEAVSIPFRYVWPAELDLMAQLAGLTLRERWGGWGREAFTELSPDHVSVWETPS